MNSTKRTPPVNTSAVKDPKWSGQPGETAVLVSRGEPNRSDVQMQQIVHGQLTRYMAVHTAHDFDDLTLTMAAQLIAEDYIDPEGSQAVMLRREHVLAFVELAGEKLATLKRAKSMEDGIDA